MTDEEFKTRVQIVMERDGVPEDVAKEKVSIEAGHGGDIAGDQDAIDPVAALDRLGNAWKPKKPQ